MDLGGAVYLIGILCSTWCVWDLSTNKPVPRLWCTIISLLVLAASWAGLALYYFLIRRLIPD